MTRTQGHRNCSRRNCGLCARTELNAVKHERAAPPALIQCGRCGADEQWCACPHDGAPDMDPWYGVDDWWWLS